MTLWPRLRSWLRAVVRRSRTETDMDAELRFHIESYVEDLTAGGMPRREALRRAHLEFGSIDARKEECRASLGLRLWDELRADLRYGMRIMRRSPGFAAVAVITLAVGIGANTAIFQLIDAIRLRTLPVDNPRELVEVRLTDRTGWRGSQQSWNLGLTNPLWEHLRDRPLQSFVGMFAWAPDDFNLAPGGEVRHARGLWVSGDFFRVLGVRPALGHLFSTADDGRGCGLSGAVISYAFWQREFGGDPSVIGRKLTLDFDAVSIIGVTPPGFFGIEVGKSFDVALPVCAQATLGGRYSFLDAGTIWWLSVMGRLKPGESPDRASAELRAASQSIFRATLPADYPTANVKDYLNFKLAAHPAGNGISSVREQYEDPLWLLLGAAGLVLLIACANLANLILARASTRGREIAQRLALGASRGRLIRQLLTESFLLAAVGAVLSLFLAEALSRFMVALLSNQGDMTLLDLHRDWRVLAFTGGIAALTCVLFGLTPALKTTRLSGDGAISAAGRGSTATREQLGLRRVLVAAQVALSLVLLLGALLFSRSLRNLLTLDAGFRQDDILITAVDMTRLKLPLERRLPFKRELLERLRMIPGVQAAAEAGYIPVSGSASDNGVWIDGSDPEQRTVSNFAWISGDYFKTLEVPFLAGRDFDRRDTPSSPKVAIVNEAFARKLNLGANPVGKRFWREATPSDPGMIFEIVGLVKDTKYRNLRQGFVPIAFLSTSQDSRPDWFDQILVRSNLSAADATARLRHAIADVSPEIAVEFQVFKAMVRQGLLRERLMAALSSFFGFLAGFLVATGLYGVMSYMVAQRTNEIGIRMALGAQRADIIRMVCGESLLVMVLGFGFGVPVALVSSWLLSSKLYGLSPDDPLTIIAAVSLMTAVVAVATYVPAKRAARVEPMMALRYE